MNRSIYRQADKRWSSLAYPTRSSSFGGNGCGACSVLHCIIEMDKYKNWTPANVQPYMKQFAVNYQGTLWSGIPTAMKHYGLQDVKNIPTMNQLWKELAKGNRVGILLFGSHRGPDGTVWTGGGHYIAFVDYKVEKGQHWLYLKDSGGRHHDKWWSYEKSMKGDVLQVWTGKLPNGHTDTDPYKASLKKTGYTGSIPSSTVGRKYGTKAEVKKWQKFLNWWYNFGLEVDGDFGNKTEIATIDFQDAHNLGTDGVAGPKTLAKAKTYLAKTTTPTKTTSTPSVAATTVSQSKFTKEKVIDISYIQSKTIDWKKVKADGVAGVIIRCGYRGYSSAKLYEDSMFMKHVAGAQSVGLKIGVYFFTEAINAKEGKEEAQFALKLIKKAGIVPTYPIAVDTESINGSPTPRANTSRLSTANRTEAIKAFCEEIKANGYEPMIYASTSWLNNQLNMSKLPYTVWVAQYNDKVTYKGSYAIWQYSSTGKVSGISQVVDMNWCYKEYKSKTQAAAPVKTTSTATTTVKTTSTSTSTSTKLVVDGIGGKSTVSALQKFLGIAVDGFISGQSKNDKQYHASLSAVKYGSGGSITVKWLQKWLGISVDGYWGKSTSKALQKKLKVTVDGYFGPASMKALQKYLNEHTKATYPEKTLIDKLLDACKTQANWMKNYTYQWQEKPTVAKSKTKGTCVTYVACVLQRIGILKSGEYIWHTANGKVVGANSKMKVTYPSGSLKSLKGKLKKGDIVIAGNKSSTGAGGTSHIFILTGKWSDAGNPYIWDNNSATRIRKGQSGKHTYSGSTKVIAVIRLK